METKETLPPKGLEGLQHAITNMIDARVKLAKDIMDSVQSSIDKASNAAKDAISGEKENSALKAVSSAINKRAEAVENLGDNLAKRKKA